MGIDHGGLEITMPQQLLNRSDIIIGLKQVTGKAVAKGMRRGPFGEFRSGDRFFDGLLKMRLVMVIPSEFVSI